MKYRIIGEAKWIFEPEHGNYTRITYYRVQKKVFYFFWKDIRIDSVLFEFETPSSVAAERTLMKVMEK